MKYQEILTIVALIAFSAITAHAETTLEQQRYQQLDQEQIAIDDQRVDLAVEAAWINAQWEQAKSWPMHQQVQRDKYLNQRMVSVNQRCAQLNARYNRNAAEMESIMQDLWRQQVPRLAPDERDCLLVATEAYARMQKTAYWARIAGFTWFENNKKMGGHAVLFVQPTEQSNIWMYDATGSYEIHTQIHELGEIILVLNQSLEPSNIRVGSPRWLENDHAQQEFASTKSDRQPVWHSTGSLPISQSGFNPILAMLTLIAVTAMGIILRWMRSRGELRAAN